MSLRDRALRENDRIRRIDSKLADEIAKWMETARKVD
jgi:hypothetical protein